ncbi:alpha-ketoacid dehydrogenase subunit alpha/beta [Novosphingobium cyanobacteriorum]|uniref:2-oxoglutarate dehydrogenase E1 component n=1 Tax=Novosphingobium cyanobacteriorum TaxID=3024215 RepID=A0ABT6CK81_9SPHN|nr:alpha-ketoacid dehydrogenase subunit alpha/beta [Novosphingobium cyanobacteriorum]MDF8333480.1 thiamine pyrophosphate-dependent enzyme [Novosphingobium cyanobacteriorum]
MPEIEQLSPHSSWQVLASCEPDWDGASPVLLGTMLTQLHLIRAFEETVLDLAAQGLVHGPAHSSIGQEGGAVGSIVGLRPSDAINGSHRGHHQFLAKALGFVAPAGLDPMAAIDPVVHDLLVKTLAEIMGLAQGFCRGRGGSMHLQWKEAGALGTNAIVGGGVPLAAGHAWAQRRARTDDVTISYFGDGAVNIGSVLEAMNLAGAWRLPMCFFIENNLYAVATAVDEATAEPRLSSRALAFGIPGWRVDGMDPLATKLVMDRALDHMRSGRGPVVIEAEVYRYFHQNGSLPGSAFGYRRKAEEAEWRKRDPLDRVSGEMIRRNLITQEAVDALRQRCITAMHNAAASLTESDPERDGRSRIKPALWPSPTFRDVGIRGDLSETQHLRTLEAGTYRGEVADIKMIDAVAGVMARRMETDDRVVVMGEDVHRLKGGTNGATRGLAERFPDRVLGTPISENAFVGLGGGIALDARFRPVVEFMYPDFMWVAADQVFNQIGKARHMFGGDHPVPLVLRTKIAIGTGYGSQHSMDPAGIFATNPGWRIVAPSTPFDYIGAMNAALACDDPVLVIEHVDLYSRTGPVPAGDLDYAIPVGKASIRRQGSRLTVLTYLAMVDRVLEAVDLTGCDAEVIDLRWLDRASFDWETVSASVMKTGSLLIVEQGAEGTSYGAWVSDEVQRRLFDWLDQPVKRVTGSEAAPSVSRVLERAAYAGTEEVVTALIEAYRDIGLSVAGHAEVRP